MELVKESDKVLRNTCEPWDFVVDGDPMPIIEQMTKVMFTHGGIGLAAPQVGINKRLFIMGNQDLLVACINPEIVETIGTIRDVEGCLSFPNLWLHVYRGETIKIRYTQVDNTIKESELSGLMARVYQHELDHLNGVCFDTKVGKVSLQLAQKRRKKFK
jgi:peptide deformylase